MFDIYNGCISEECEKIIQRWFEILVNHSTYTEEIIISNIEKYYYNQVSSDLAVSYVQNHDFNDTLNNSVNFLGQNKEEKFKNTYAYFLNFSKQEIKASIGLLLREVIYPEILIVEDIKYSVMQQRSTLKRTLSFLQKFEYREVNDEYHQAVNVFESEIDSYAKSNGLLKILKGTQVNHISCHQDIGLYYLHIVNLICGVYVLKDKIKQYDKLIKIFKYNLDTIDDILYTNEMDNLARKLTNFYEQVNYDQIDRYVIIYYYKTHVNKSIQFDKFKRLCSRLFRKNFQTLNESSFNIDKIPPPMNFEKFPFLVNIRKVEAVKFFTLHQLLCKGQNQVD